MIVASKTFWLINLFARTINIKRVDIKRGIAIFLKAIAAGLIPLIFGKTLLPKMGVRVKATVDKIIGIAERNTFLLFFSFNKLSSPKAARTVMEKSSRKIILEGCIEDIRGMFKR